MKPSRIRRHVWNERDVCIECGLRRDGYSGGHTGMTRYTTPDGQVRWRAGECPRKDDEAISILEEELRAARAAYAALLTAVREGAEPADDLPLYREHVETTEAALRAFRAAKRALAMR